MSPHWAPKLCVLKSLLITIGSLSFLMAFCSAKVCIGDNYDCSHQIGSQCTVYRGECYQLNRPEEVPSEPGDLTVSYFLENGVMGLNVSWSFPDDVSVKALTGFMVEILPYGLGKRECFKVDIPKVSEVQTNATDPAKMFIDCFRHIVDDMSYDVIVSSLPSPGLPHGPKSVKRHIIIPKIIGVSPDQCTWTPVVSWQQDVDSLQVTVQQSPPGSLREIHNFSFFKCLSEPCDVRNLEKINEIERKGMDRKPVMVTFQQLEAARYLLHLVITCEKYNKMCADKCQYKERISQYYITEINQTLGGQISSSSELGLPSTTAIGKSVPPTLTRKKPIERSTTEATEKIEVSTTEEPMSPTPVTNTTGLVVGLTIACVSVAAVAVALVVLFACKNDPSIPKLDSGRCYRVLEIFQRERPPVLEPVQEVPSNNPEIVLPVLLPIQSPPVLKPEIPVVMIINSYDFAAHEDCVIAFAQFLHNHANCEVRHHRIGHDAASNKFNWICKEMEKASKIIIIHSEGSKLQYHCQEETRSSDIPPEGDIFKMAFNHIISKYNKKETEHHRFLNARFSYSPDSSIITDIFGQANNYILMNHIHDLIAIIHGIPLHSPGGSLATEIFHPNMYHKVPLGSDLKSKIVKAAQLVKENPQYFCSSLHSKDSGLSMLPDNSSSGSQNNTDNGILIPQANTYSNDLFARMESPPVSLTDAGELCQPTFARQLSNFNPGEHDEFFFIPPSPDSDSENSSVADPAESAEINNRLFQINLGSL